MASPQLVAQAERTVSEAELRALALAKVKACRAYTDHLYTDTRNLSDDALVDHEMELIARRKAMNAAVAAFDGAL